jgi:hypothetical protein
MAHALVPVSRGYLLAGAAIATGLYAMRDRGEVTQHVAAPVASVTPMQVSAPRPLPTLVALVAEPQADAIDDEMDDLEEVRGHAAITDSAEFALVFELEGTSYIRLSTELRATARGRARMIVEDGVHAVVAPVAASALPGGLANKWRDRTMLVNGTCEARVIGFAEVSRVSGDPPGSEDYWFGSDDERPAKEPTWTRESIVADNVTLVAKLDGCSGTWARGSDYERAQVAHSVSAPGLETEALADLLARTGEDPIQDEWKQMGRDGDWRDSIDVQATTYEHPTTGEKWIFARAYKDGDCGEFSVSKMAAYRVGSSGKIHRFTDLEFAGEPIEDVVDLDGDGQPELVLGGSNAAELVDLANTRHDSISVPFHHYGCGC